LLIRGSFFFWRRRRRLDSHRKS